MKIEVVYAQPDDQRHEEVELAEGADVAQCLQFLSQHPSFSDLVVEGLTPGIFGEVCSATHMLQEGERLELYRPLLIDAKTARRVRAKAQKA
jgi:hypothetical protein